MKNLKIGLGQINSKNNIKENLVQMKKVIEECSSKGAELVVFPEASSYLSLSGAEENSQSIDGEIINELKNMAVKHKVYIHNGSFAEKDMNSDKIFNTSVFINPKGEIEAVYRKIHLFDVSIDKENTFNESSKYKRGNEIINLSNEIGQFGFTICYDLRFPELFRKLTFNGAKLIFVPAAFTLFTGKDHWEPLLRARAIENQVYIVAVGQFGEFEKGKKSFGNSMVIDPWGTVIAKSSDKVDTLIAEIEWDYIDSVRNSIPSLKNRVELENI